VKIAFLDRDGTIIKDYPDEKWHEIAMPEFLEGVIKSLKKITDMGYKIIIITNQYLIGENYISQNDYDKFSKMFLDILGSNNIDVLDVFYCPHARNSGCNCCKPKTGLIKQAIAKYPEINLAQSFFCGDSLCDMELAKDMNISFYGINLHLDSVQSITSFSDLIRFIQ